MKRWIVSEERRQKLFELATENVDKHLGDVAGDYESEEELAEAIEDEVYVLAFDAVVDAGAEDFIAREIALLVLEQHKGGK